MWFSAIIIVGCCGRLAEAARIAVLARRWPRSKLRTWKKKGSGSKQLNRSHAVTYGLTLDMVQRHHDRGLLLQTGGGGADGGASETMAEKQVTYL